MLFADVLRPVCAPCADKHSAHGLAWFVGLAFVAGKVDGDRLILGDEALTAVTVIVRGPAIRSSALSCSLFGAIVFDKSRLISGLLLSVFRLPRRQRYV